MLVDVAVLPERLALHNQPAVAYDPHMPYGADGVSTATYCVQQPLLCFVSCLGDDESPSAHDPSPPANPSPRGEVVLEIEVVHVVVLGVVGLVPWASFLAHLLRSYLGNLLCSRRQ